MRNSTENIERCTVSRVQLGTNHIVLTNREKCMFVVANLTCQLQNGNGEKHRNMINQNLILKPRLLV